MSENVLSRNQRRALAALLVSKSIQEAAGTCGLTDRQIYRYLEKTEFRQALIAAETETIDAAGRRLLVGQSRALDVLDAMMSSTDVSDANKRQAAATWLDYVLRWRELRNVEQRLAALESEVFNDKKR